MLSLSNVSLKPIGAEDSATIPNLFKNLNLFLEDTDSVAVIGPNGSGKSTLIKCIAGIFGHHKGEIKFGSDVRIGYMPQNYREAVLSWLSIEDHFNLTLSNVGKKKALSFLETIGFKPQIKRKLANMSGGEIQLLLLSTLIGQDCKLLLLDEPLSAVDFIRRDRALKALETENEVEGRSIVMVSHHLEDAKKICGRVVVLSGRNEDTPKIAKCTPNLNIADLFVI